VLVPTWRIIPDVRGVVCLRLFCSQLGIVASLACVVSQLIKLVIHIANGLLQRVHSELLGVCEIGVLVLVLRLVCALVELVELCPFGVAIILLLHIVVVLRKPAEADAVSIAIAGILGRAVDLVASEDVVPDVLEDAAGELIVHARCEQPLAVVDETLDRHLPDPVARDGELCAADAGDGGRHGSARVDLVPDALAPVDLLGLVEEVEVAARAVHVDPVGAAGVVVAANVHVAEAGDALVVQAVDDLGGIEAHQLVVVPGMAVGVHEKRRVRQVVVVVDDVAEVYLARGSAYMLYVPLCTVLVLVLGTARNIP
jgi:hypothetical protein